MITDDADDEINIIVDEPIIDIYIENTSENINEKKYTNKTSNS